MKLFALLLSLFLAAPVYAQQLNPGGGIIVSGGPVNAVFPPGPVSITGDSGNGGDQINNVSINGVVNVKAYGAMGNGSHDDSTNIQNAINAAGSTACIYFPAGTYLVTHDLNFTSNALVKCVRGDDPANTKILCEDVGGNCADFSGSDGFSIRDIQITGGTSAANAPKVSLLLARTGTTANPRAAQGFGHVLRDVWVGNYGTYTIFDYGAELGHWDHVLGTNVVISACNAAGIQSQFQPINGQYIGTSMSAMYISNSYFNGPSTGLTGCALTFDDGCVNGLIHDIAIWGTYWGEFFGGGTAMCDMPPPPGYTPGSDNQVLTQMTVIGTRMEAADGTAGTPYPTTPVNRSYGFINFANSQSFGVNLIENDIGTPGQLNSPAMVFGGFTDSQIQVAVLGGGMAPGVLALTSPFGRSSQILGTTPSQMTPELYLGDLQSGNHIGNEGNFLQWNDGAPTYYGHTDAGGMEANNHIGTLNATTSGTVNWNMPAHALGYKVVVLSFQAYLNSTTTAQVITYPVTFLSSPTAYGSCPTGMLVPGNAVSLPTSMSAAFTGQCIIAGQ